MDCNSPTWRFSFGSTPDPLRDARMVSTRIWQRSLASTSPVDSDQQPIKTRITSRTGCLNRIVFTFHIRIFVVPEDGLSRFGGFKNHNR